MTTPKTKTVIGALGTLMIAGMISSLVNGSATYFKGSDSVANTPSVATFGQTSVLFSDLNEGTPSRAKKPEPLVLRARPTVTTPSVQVQREVTPQPVAQNAQPVEEKTVVLDFGYKSKSVIPETKNQSAPFYAPVSCEGQDQFTYTGSDNGNLLYGSCIPCAMNKFNVQSKTCSK